MIRENEKEKVLFLDKAVFGDDRVGDFGAEDAK